MLKVVSKSASNLLNNSSSVKITSFFKETNMSSLLSLIRRESIDDVIQETSLIAGSLIEVNCKPHPNVKDYRNKLTSVLDGQIMKSDWYLVDQKLINDFAFLTGDTQWIHTDIKKAVDSPFGSTIAHGYLILSLLPVMLNKIFAQHYFINDAQLVVNAGIDQVKFLYPVKANSKIRANVKLSSVMFLKKNVVLVNEVEVVSEYPDKRICSLVTKTNIYFDA